MVEPRLPRRFGHYLLLELLGGGATGTAHLARCLDPSRGLPSPLVVKSLHPALRDNPSSVRRFRHEAMLCVAVDHPNVAKVFEAGAIDGTLYFSMELVQGLRLSTVLERLATERVTVPVPAAVALIRGALLGLEALHTAKNPETGQPLEIVHRDLSPNNLIAGADGALRLIDLGLGKSNARAWETKTGAVLGTLGYMSPEQARGERADLRADLYTLGVVFWEILMLRRYIYRSDRDEMLNAMVDPTFVAPTAKRSDLPSALIDVMTRAVAVDPAARFSSAREMLEAIESAAAGASVGSSDAAFRAIAGVTSGAGRAGGADPGSGPTPDEAHRRVASLLESALDGLESGPEDVLTEIFAERRAPSAEAPTRVTGVHSIDILSADLADTAARPGPGRGPGDPGDLTAIRAPGGLSGPPPTTTGATAAHLPHRTVRSARVPDGPRTLVVGTAIVLALGAILAVAGGRRAQEGSAGVRASGPPPGPTVEAEDLRPGPRAKAAEKVVAPADGAGAVEPSPPTEPEAARRSSKRAAERVEAPRRAASPPRGGVEGASAAGAPAPAREAAVAGQAGEAEEDPAAAVLARILARAERAKTEHPGLTSEIYPIVADATLWGRTRDRAKALSRLRALEAQLERLVPAR